MNYFDFIVRHQNSLGVEGIFQNPNLTLEMIENNLGFFNELIKTRSQDWLLIQRLITRNPNIPLKYILEHLNESSNNSSLRTALEFGELSFKRECIEWNFVSKRVTLEDYYNYREIFEMYIIGRHPIKFIEDLTIDQLKILKDLWFRDRSISRNKHLTVEFIRRNLDYQWNWQELCLNPCLTIKDLYSQKEFTIKSRLNEEGIIEEYWLYADIICNPSLKWGESLPEEVPIIEPSLTSCQIDFDELDINSLNNHQIKFLTWNKKLPIELVLSHPEKNWDYNVICQNGNHPLEQILKIPNVALYSRALSYNPNVHWTDIERYPFIHWNFQSLPWNHHNGKYVLYSQKYKIYRWITDKYSGYFKRMATWLAYQVKESWWSPDNKITTKLRENAFKLGTLRDIY